MSSPEPSSQVSAITSVLDDLTGRVTTLAESLDRQPTEHVAASMYEVERSLRAARRSLARAARALG